MSYTCYSQLAVWKPSCVHHVAAAWLQLWLCIRSFLSDLGRYVVLGDSDTIGELLKMSWTFVNDRSANYLYCLQPVELIDVHSEYL